MVREDWFMLLDNSVLYNDGPRPITYLSVINVTDNMLNKFVRVINIPLHCTLHRKFIWKNKFRRNIDVANSFSNIGNEYYLKNIIEMIEQIAAQGAEAYFDTLDTADYFNGYKTKYKLVGNEEMKKLFASNIPFFYLLKCVSNGMAYTVILEGTTGKIITGKVVTINSMDACNMGWVYKHCLTRVYCKKEEN